MYEREINNQSINQSIMATYRSNIWPYLEMLPRLLTPSDFTNSRNLFSSKPPRYQATEGSIHRLPGYGCSFWYCDT